jgi:lipopolysaccharide biosynthesis glycosyltransferase
MNNRYLVYYTHGYSNGYLDILKLSIKSLRSTLKENCVDIVILSDEQFVNDCNQIDNVNVISMPNSNTPEQASMHKLHIFNAYNEIDKYDGVLFIDSDILVLYDVRMLLEQFIKSNSLYVYTESNDYNSHRCLFWSLEKYTDEQINYFKENNILPFNAGFFGFKPDETMRRHFNNVIEMIKNHVGNFFYEQSFINTYFNSYHEIITDRTVITADNYIMHPNDNHNYGNKCIHFCGSPGNSSYKLPRMMSYMNRFGINT